MTETTRSLPGGLGAVAFVALPALAVVLGAGAGLLQWQAGAQRGADSAADDAVSAAGEAAVVMLSYRSDTVEQDLLAARDRLTGEFVQSYTDLVNKVVIPGAREKKISAAARVAAMAPVSVAAGHVVTLAFIDQTITMGSDAPSDTSSSVRITMDRVGQRWLVSGFDPV